MSRIKKEKEAKELLKKGMTKKALRERHSAQRVLVGMNTGTRTHKTAKDYNRQKAKQETKRMVKE